VALLEILGQIGGPDYVPVLLDRLDGKESKAIRQAALSALQSFQDPRIAETVLASYTRLPADLRGRAQTLLCSRVDSTRALLEAVDAGKIAPKEISLDQVRRILLHQDEEIHQLVEKHWGKVGQASPGEKLARMSYIQIMIRRGKGDPVAGKPLFQKHCGTCHTLFGEGAKVGPDLTGADRKDLNFLLSSTVDPSSQVRTEYVAQVILTKNCRLLTGLIAESTPATITLVDAKNERTILPREEIEEMRPSPQSLMPEKILDELDDQQLRDLFSYLQSNR
jgi:putative heme-binding domain-containing protein